MTSQVFDYSDLIAKLSIEFSLLGLTPKSTEVSEWLDYLGVKSFHNFEVKDFELSINYFQARRIAKEQLEHSVHLLSSPRIEASTIASLTTNWTPDFKRSVWAELRPEVKAHLKQLLGKS